MRTHRLFTQTKLLLSVTLLSNITLVRAEGDDGPRPTPLTRPVLKKLIEDVKVRTPRIPLPELTELDREKLGDQVNDYETRLRYHYFNGIEPSRPISPVPTPNAMTTDKNNAAGRSREQDPNFSLDPGFKVQLFWIVSRVNNCQYCLGHQESKLLGAGKSEDQIASLDGDWSEFQPAEQVAFAFARKFSFQPYLLEDQDIIGLRNFYTDAQILEMILSMSGNNSINRWKEGVAVPQRKDEGGYSRLSTLGTTTTLDPSLPRGTYLTPTSPRFENQVSSVVAVDSKEGASKVTLATKSNRPKLESREQVVKMLDSCRTRTARLPLMTEQQTKTNIPATQSVEDILPNWVRLLANFPSAGKSRYESIQAADNGGDLSPLLKAQIAWIVARQDRAWYALGQSMNRLRSAGQSEADIARLDGDWKSFSDRERSLFQVAKNLSLSPVVLSDNEVAEAVKYAGPRDTVQTISYVTSRASFNRLTEAAGLPIER